MTRATQEKKTICDVKEVLIHFPRRLDIFVDRINMKINIIVNKLMPVALYD